MVAGWLIVVDLYKKNFVDSPLDDTLVVAACADQMNWILADASDVYRLAWKVAEATGARVAVIAG